ncbi:hypothetical protein B0H13DRAFT_1904300 [Mycena leptocephala]|nr:hypothetical protein B0H13DRAFT_1904300 [Mycena leptocephala]
MGPASNARPMTRATTALAGVFSPAGTPPVLPIVSMPVNHSPFTPISTFDHFKLKSAFKTKTVKPLAESTSANVSIIADHLRLIETQIHATARDVANLTSEVRLCQPVHPESSRPLLGKISMSRSDPAPRNGRRPETMIRSEDAWRTLNSRLKQGHCRSRCSSRGSLSGGTAAITVTELHKGVVENIKAIKGDLEVLNEEIYVRAEEQTKAVAALSVKSKAAIARLELAPPPPLLLRSQRDSESHARHPARHSVSPPPHHSQSRVVSRESVSHAHSQSPHREQPAKRQRRDEDNGYISLGPVGESAETPTRLFELHLRTTTPNFHLEVPYAMELDPTYRDHLRVTVKSEAVARSLTDAWVRNTVAGYAKIKMVRMRSAGGNQSAEINSYPNTWPIQTVPAAIKAMPRRHPATLHVIRNQAVVNSIFVTTSTTFSNMNFGTCFGERVHLEEFNAIVRESLELSTFKCDVEKISRCSRTRAMALFKSLGLNLILNDQSNHGPRIQKENDRRLPANLGRLPDRQGALYKATMESQDPSRSLREQVDGLKSNFQPVLRKRKTRVPVPGISTFSATEVPLPSHLNLQTQQTSSPTPSYASGVQFRAPLTPQSIPRSIPHHSAPNIFPAPSPLGLSSAAENDDPF